LIEEALALLRARIEERGLMAAWELERPDVVVRADRDKILQVFLNLISNAIKFNRNGGRIDVVAGRGEPGYLEVQVRDTGSGISDEELERIFDRFYRAAEPAGQRGSGIGLAIVRNILHLHGCTIRAESRRGEGSTFRFTLPCVEDPTARHEGSSTGRVGKPEPSPTAPRSRADADAAPGERGDNAEQRRRFRIIRRDREAEH